MSYFSDSWKFALGTEDFRGIILTAQGAVKVKLQTCGFCAMSKTRRKILGLKSHIQKPSQIFCFFVDQIVCVETDIYRSVMSQ